jgi:hypothetical protein
VIVELAGLRHEIECDSKDGGGYVWMWSRAVPECPQCRTPMSEDGYEDTKRATCRPVWAGEFEVECCACGYSAAVQ